MKDVKNQKTKNSSKIYTFLSGNKLPPYLKLCLKTWHLNKPDDYEIKILTPENLHDVLPAEVLTKFQKQTGQCSFPYFVDYLAVLVLYYNGGIFLDADTLFTRKIKANSVLLKSTNMVVFAENKKDICCGYMMANKGSVLLEEMIRRYEFASYLPKGEVGKRNFILSDTAKDFSSDDILYLDCEESGYVMEKNQFGIMSDYVYKKYYFSDICPVQDFFENSKGITGLLNSATPQEYKNMSVEEFLSQNILLSKVLNRIITAQSA